MRWVAGMTMQRTPGAAFLPFITFAAMRRSSMRPLVHEPITTWSIATLPTRSIGRVFSGRCGNATVGFSVDRSILTVRS